MPGFVAALLVILSIFIGAGSYTALRLYKGLSCFFPNLRLFPILSVFIAFVLITVLGFGRSVLPLSSDAKHILGVISAYCMGIFLYLLLFTAAADIIMLIPRIIKLPFTAHRLFSGIITLTVLLLTSATCLYGFINARQIDHVRYEISLQNKADISDLNMVVISDLHLGSVGSEARLKSIVDEINALEPDLLCISGDFFDTDFAAIQNPKAALETLSELKTTYGVYTCLGNHDAGSSFKQMTEFLSQANIQTLNDEYTVIDNKLVLVGRLDGHPIGGFGSQKRKELSEFFVREDPLLPVVVLDHNPASVDQYGSEADLVLCGHTHKGQLFPASLITDSIFSVDHGYYKKDEQSPHVIVTSGIGNWGMPMRVGTDCEIVTVKFIANKTTDDFK